MTRYGVGHHSVQIIIVYEAYFPHQVFDFARVLVSYVDQRR